MYIEKSWSFIKFSNFNDIIADILLIFFLIHIKILSLKFSHHFNDVLKNTCSQTCDLFCMGYDVTY